MTEQNYNPVPLSVQNLIGKKFDRLTVIGYGHVKRVKNGTKHYWFVECDCGEIKEMRGDQIKGKNIISCGCYKREIARETLKRVSTTHGKSGTPVYNVWLSMRRRCSDPNNAQYIYYGGRGIGVCRRWNESFEEFHRDMGDPPLNYTLERIDNNLGYSPDNCKWATWEEQNNNRRNSHFVTINGKTKTITEWSREYGINAHTVYGRIHRGRDPVEAITTPVTES
jgi:hypothetical protein